MSHGAQLIVDVQLWGHGQEAGEVHGVHEGVDGPGPPGAVLVVQKGVEEEAEQEGGEGEAHVGEGDRVQVRRVIHTVIPLFPSIQHSALVLAPPAPSPSTSPGHRGYLCPTINGMPTHIDTCHFGQFPQPVDEVLGDGEQDDVRGIFIVEVQQEDQSLEGVQGHGRG